jgi:uncharacterized protein
MSEPLPLFPLQTVLFPGMFLPLHIFEDRYQIMIRHCLATESAFGVALIRSGREVGGPAVPHPVGTTARIIRLDELEDGRLNLVALGEERFRIRELRTDLPYLQALTEPVHDSDLDDPDLPQLARETGAEFKRYIAMLLSFANRWIVDFDMPAEPDVLSHYVATRLNVLPARKQRLVEMTTARGRLLEEQEMMRREIAQMELLASAKTSADGTDRPS